MSEPRSPKPVGRPRSFDQAVAIHSAMRVFWERGFEGASISELTRAMGIKPASLYGAFGNKEDLFKKALDHYIATEVPFVQQALEEPTAYAVVERLLRDSALFLSRPGFPRGCMTIQASQVTTEEGAQVHRELIELRLRSQKKLRDRFSRAKREGDLTAESRPDSLARFIVAVYEGMTVQSVNGASRKDLLDVAETSLRVGLSTKAG